MYKVARFFCFMWTLGGSISVHILQAFQACDLLYMTVVFCQFLQPSLELLLASTGPACLLFQVRQASLSSNSYHFTHFDICFSCAFVTISTLVRVPRLWLHDNASACSTLCAVYIQCVICPLIDRVVSTIDRMDVFWQPHWCKHRTSATQSSSVVVDLLTTTEAYTSPIVGIFRLLL